MSDALREALDIAESILNYLDAGRPCHPGEPAKEILVSQEYINRYRSALGALASAPKPVEPGVARLERSLAEEMAAHQLVCENYTIAQAALDAAKAEIVRLRGGEQETFSDQKREHLFKGSGIDYIRHRALKHETQYYDLAQAQHLRQLATDIEVRLDAAKAEAKGLREALEDLMQVIEAMRGSRDMTGSEARNSTARAEALLRAEKPETLRPEDPVGDPYNGWKMFHDGAGLNCVARDDTWEIAGIGRSGGPTKFYRMDPVDGTIAPLGKPAPKPEGRTCETCDLGVGIPCGFLENCVSGPNRLRKDFWRPRPAASDGKGEV